MERETKAPDIRTLRMRGIDLRSGRHALQDGLGDRVFGLYPAQTGLLQRIPGKRLYRKLSGTVRNVYQTFDGSGNVLVQIDSRLEVFTLDEFLNRTQSYDIEEVIPDTPSALPRAVIVQREASTVKGGSLSGFISGSDTTTAADTFYGRRLTNIILNETQTTDVVAAFNQSTGGAGAVSTAGTFELAPGTYQINVTANYGTIVGGTYNLVWGLFNTTDGRFAAHSGTSEPMLGTTFKSDEPGSFDVSLAGFLTVPTGGNKTFAIYHKGSTQAAIRELTACGHATTMTTANVTPVGGAAAAATNTYCIVEIVRYSVL